MAEVVGTESVDFLVCTFKNYERLKRCSGISLKFMFLCKWIKVLQKHTTYLIVEGFDVQIKASGHFQFEYSWFKAAKFFLLLTDFNNIKFHLTFIAIHGEEKQRMAFTTNFKVRIIVRCSNYVTIAGRHLEILFILALSVTIILCTIGVWGATLGIFIVNIHTN